MRMQCASSVRLGMIVVGLFACGCQQDDESASTPSALTGSTSIVISQIYGGGGNSGAFYTNDYVELFNRGTAAQSVAGWSIQHGGATVALNDMTALSGTVAPGGYLLVQFASGGATGAPLPMPDVTSTVGLSNSSAKVVLVNTTTQLTCGAAGNSCIGNPAVVDLVGYGATSDFEGAHGPALDNTHYAQRAGGGCTDTDNNANDFTALVGSASTAHNSSSPVSPCSVMMPGDDGGADDDGGMAMPDLSSPPDMTVLPDLAMPVDMASSTTGTGEVVISQVYGAGGSTGATFKSDYIELFNRGSVPVAIGNWSVQYGSAANNFSQHATIPAGTIINAGHYFLVALSSDTVGADLPTPDFAPTGTAAFNISASNGKVALVDDVSVLACGAAATRCSSTAISDLVGFGTSSDFEGHVAPTPGASTKALFRAAGGCLDSNDNKNDVSTGSAAPRNSATPAVDCTALDLSVPVDDLAVSLVDLAGGGEEDLSASGAGGGGGGGAGGGGGSGKMSSDGCSIAPAAAPSSAAPVLMLLACALFLLRRFRNAR